MKRAYTNGILLDGTEQMEPVRGKVLLTENDIAETVDGESKLFHMHSFGKKPGAASWPLARHS